MGSDDLLVSAYMADLRQYAVLSADDERQLAQRMKRGLQAARALAAAPPSVDRAPLEQLIADGRAARDTLVACNQRLVVYCAKRFLHRGLALMDLIQEGNLGLLSAVDRFDGDRGLRFSTFAVYWIRHGLRRGLMQRGRTIPLPIHVAEAAEQLERRRADLQEQLSREPTDGELARGVGLSIEQFRALEQVAQPVCSLDAPAFDHGTDATMDGLIDPAPLPDEQALRAVDGATLRAVVADMEPPQRSVLTLRFGLGDGQPRSRPQTATLLNISQDMVVRCERSGLAWLRAQGWRWEDRHTTDAADLTATREPHHQDAA